MTLISWITFTVAELTVYPTSILGPKTEVQKSCQYHNYLIKNHVNMTITDMQKAFMKCTHWPIWISLHQEKDNNSAVLTHKQLISSMIRGTTNWHNEYGSMQNLKHGRNKQEIIRHSTYYLASLPQSDFTNLPISSINCLREKIFS